MRIKTSQTELTNLYEQILQDHIFQTTYDNHNFKYMWTDYEDAYGDLRHICVSFYNHKVETISFYLHETVEGRGYKNIVTLSTY